MSIASTFSIHTNQTEGTWTLVSPHLSSGPGLRDGLQPLWSENFAKKVVFGYFLCCSPISNLRAWNHLYNLLYSPSILCSCTDISADLLSQLQIHPYTQNNYPIKIYSSRTCMQHRPWFSEWRLYIQNDQINKLLYLSKLTKLIWT